MTAKDVLKTALGSTQFLLTSYLGDLADADLLVRPAPTANNIAWQLGHLIHSEIELLKAHLPKANYPTLPASFADDYTATRATGESTQGYRSKADYIDLFQKVRAESINGVDHLSEADLEKPMTGPMAAFAPTLAAQILLVSNHTLMHAGQFTVLRRKLGKPILF